MESNSKTPKWLLELQQKSWEPEVLLSGIVLYGMFKAPELLDDFLYYFKVNIETATTDIDNFVGLMKVAMYWLTGGLIAHLISRGIWIGMVGLSFTYPKGIDLEKLTLSEKFKKYLSKIPSSEQIILNLESFSSSLFSVSFMMFMMIVGAYFYLLMTVIVPVLALIFFAGTEIFQNQFAKYVILAYLFGILIIGLIGFIDFITLGFFKRINWLSKIYWPVYRFVGTLTLARFYRPIYYILVSNVKRWKIAVLFSLFVISSFYWVEAETENRYPGENLSQITLWSDMQGTAAFAGYYDDQIDDIKSVEAQIQSDIIRGNTLRLFIVLKASREDSIKAHCNLDSLVSLEGVSSGMARLMCVTDFYSVYIDDSLYQDIPMKFHYKSKTKQRGILGYVDISELPPGLHHVEVKLPEEMYRSSRVANIPFYREMNFNPYYIPEIVPKKEEEGEPYLKLKPILPK